MFHRKPQPPFAGLASENRRELRILVALEGTMGSSSTGKRKVELQDISCLGCRVGTILNLPIGSYVVITLPGLAPLGAQVRWSSHESLGLRFNAPLHPGVVSRIEASVRA